MEIIRGQRERINWFRPDDVVGATDWIHQLPLRYKTAGLQRSVLVDRDRDAVVPLPSSREANDPSKSPEFFAGNPCRINWKAILIRAGKAQAVGRQRDRIDGFRPRNCIKLARGINQLPMRDEWTVYRCAVRTRHE